MIPTHIGAGTAPSSSRCGRSRHIARHVRLLVEYRLARRHNPAGYLQVRLADRRSRVLGEADDAATPCSQTGSHKSLRRDVAEDLQDLHKATD